MSIVNSKYRGTKEYEHVYSALITAAKNRGTLTYQEISEIIEIKKQGGNFSRVSGLILGEISEDEVAKHRPMLSVIAVGKNGLPSKHFYNYARDLGKLTDQTEEEFREAEKAAVYEAWKTD